MVNDRGGGEIAISEERRLLIWRHSQGLGATDAPGDPLAWTPEEAERHGERSEREARAFIQAARDPEELHLLALQWNWDGDPEIIALIAEHPAADAGTLLLLYWRSQPEYGCQFPGRVHPTDTIDAPALLAMQRRIERRFADRDVRSRDIAFDPRDDDGTDIIALSRPAVMVESLPAMMYQPVRGRVVAP